MRNIAIASVAMSLYVYSVVIRVVIQQARVAAFTSSLITFRRADATRRAPPARYYMLLRGAAAHMRAIYAAMSLAAISLYAAAADTTSPCCFAMQMLLICHTRHAAMLLDMLCYDAMLHTLRSAALMRYARHDDFAAITPLCRCYADIV